MYLRKFKYAKNGFTNRKIRKSQQVANLQIGAFAEGRLILEMN